MSEFLANFDNREIAIAFWFLAAILVSVSVADLRTSMVGVLRAFFAKPIVICVGALIGYFAILVLFLDWVEVWTTSQLKLTVLWILTAGLAGLFSIEKVSEDSTFLKRSAKGNFRLSVVVDFFVNLYRFPLPVELVFVPGAVTLGALLAVSETQERFAPARKFLHSVAVVLGVLFLMYAVWRASWNLQAVLTVQTLRNLVLPLAFSVLLIPFLWMLGKIVAYQEVFIRLQFVIKDESLRPYVRKALIVKFRSDTSSLRKWFKESWHHEYESRDDVDRSIERVINANV